MSSFIIKHYPILHPLMFLATQRAIALAAAFTDANSALRYPAVIALAVITWQFLSTCHQYMNNRAWKSIAGFISTQFLVLYTERLLLSRWSFRAGGPASNTDESTKVKSSGLSNGNIKSVVETQRAGPNSDWKARIRYAELFLFETRGIGQPWQAKNTPPFSSREPSYIPYRAQFLRRTLLSTSLCFLIVDLLTSQPPDPALFNALDIPFFTGPRNTSAERIAMRSVIAIVHWLVGYCFINFWAGSFALVAVGLGGDSPANWRPMFGDIGEAYTVRRFWGYVKPSTFFSFEDFPRSFVPLALLLASLYWTIST